MRLVVSNASIDKGGKTRLGPINLDVVPSGITVLQGHNGAGKTLFLRLLHGLEMATGGTMQWDGQTAAATRHARGFVFQHPQVMRRSVAANVAFPLVAQQVPKREIASRVDAALDGTALRDLRDQPAAALSGGELQRMALARALITGPSVLLMDEPTASLDPAAVTIFEDILRREIALGRSAILSTHDGSQAERLATQVWRFENGRMTN